MAVNPYATPTAALDTSTQYGTGGGGEHSFIVMRFGPGGEIN